MTKLFSFNKIDVTDTLVIIALGLGFIMAINNGMNELCMSIASGFFGYVGGTANTMLKNQNTEPKLQQPLCENK